MKNENSLEEDLDEELEDTLEQDEVEILDGPPLEEADSSKELTDKLQRIMAEFDNFRKRTIKEKADIYNDGVRDTVDSLLPIIDNFTRAASSLDESDNIHKGIIMIYKQFELVLSQIGVEKIDTSGAFDANLHNAISNEESSDVPSGHIIEEVGAGYKYKDKVIRHSFVKVAI